MAWTDLSDVQRRYEKPITDAQRAWVSALIEDAEDELARRLPGLASRVVDVDPRTTELAPGQVPRARVQRVVCGAVIPVLRNPEGYLSHTTTRGPFTDVATRAADAARNVIAFDDADLAPLRAPADFAPARSIPLRLPSWRVP